MKTIEYKFNLKEHYIVKPPAKQWIPEKGKTSLVALPMGIYEIKLLNIGKNLIKTKCSFTKQITHCVTINEGWMGFNVCGDILITLIDLGYNLASTDDWKRSNNEKEAILKSYIKLVSEKPDYFNDADFFENIREELEIRAEEMYGTQRLVKKSTQETNTKEVLEKDSTSKEVPQLKSNVIISKKHFIILAVIINMIVYFSTESQELLRSNGGIYYSNPASTWSLAICLIIYFVIYKKD